MPAKPLETTLHRLLVSIEDPVETQYVLEDRAFAYLSFTDTGLGKPVPS